MLQTEYDDSLLEVTWNRMLDFVQQKKVIMISLLSILGFDIELNNGFKF